MFLRLYRLLASLCVGLIRKDGFRRNEVICGSLAAAGDWVEAVARHPKASCSFMVQNAHLSTLVPKNIPGIALSQSTYM